MLWKNMKKYPESQESVFMHFRGRKFEKMIVEVFIFYFWKKKEFWEKNLKNKEKLWKIPKKFLEIGNVVLGIFMEKNGRNYLSRYLFCIFEKIKVMEFEEN